jgi:CheY-like chemotaxis protein
MAHDNGFKAVSTCCGEGVLELAQRYKPDAITLDLRLPDMDGWVVLDRLKHNAGTRHIPVHIITIDDRFRRDGTRRGAFACLIKPVNRKELDQAFTAIKSFLERPAKRLLVIEDNEIERDSIVGLIGGQDVETVAVATGGEALAALKHGRFDCLVLDLGLPDMTGLELLERLRREGSLTGMPVVVYTAKDLPPAEETHLKEMAETIIVKDVRSLERLLDETAMFLHRVEANLPPAARRMLEQAQQTDPVLGGKRVLLVDDDFRNLFALTSILEPRGVEVFRAENGREALTVLEAHPNIDAVLMDIMMPEMDGYATTRAIRNLPAFRSLPVIALTAKAMKGDREKCLAAGASDYLAKPVNADQLLSTLRVWLSRQEGDGA